MKILTAQVGVQASSKREVGQEWRNCDALRSLVVGREPDVCHRRVREIDQCHQTSAEHRAGAAVHRDRAALDDVERHNGGVNRRSQFVGQPPQPFCLLLDLRLSVDARVLGDGVGDRRIQTAVQDVELFRGNGCLLCQRKLCHRLADIPIIVDNL